MTPNHRFLMPVSIAFIALLLGKASASPNLFPRLVHQEHRERATYNGGWALGLPSEGCPADAPVNCQDPAKDINPTCCPFGQTCFGFEQPYCCPTDTDCVNVVTNLPVCANSTWLMWQLSFTGYVCCEPGQIGMNPTSGWAGICEPADQPVVTSLIATLASQIGGPPITTGPMGGAATATTTGKEGAASATTTGASNTGTHTSALGSTGSSVLKKIHLSLGEIIGIAVGGVVLIAALIVGIWCCCCRRSRNRTQVTYVEPYRNQGTDGYNRSYNAGTGYNAGYAGYGGTRGMAGESDGVPLTNVGGYAQEYKPPQMQTSELGYDERPPVGAELGYDERR